MSVKLRAVAASPNFWTGIATLIMAVFAYFKLTPDPATAVTLGEEAAKAAEAITARNWVLFLTGLFNIGNILYHLFKP